MSLRSLAGIFTLAVLVFGSTFVRAQPVTYDFTGTVDATGGSYNSIPLGSTVTGSFVYDFSATTSSGPPPYNNPPGSAQGWVIKSSGGSGVIFSETVTVDGTTYSTGPLSSSTSGLIEGVGYSLESWESTPTLQSNMFLNSNQGGPYPYLSNGLPNLAAIDLTTGTTGGFTSYSNSLAVLGDFNYRLTSLTAGSAVPPGGVPVLPTPLPAGLWLLASGLAGLGLFRRRAG